MPPKKPPADKKKPVKKPTKVASTSKAKAVSKAHAQVYIDLRGTKKTSKPRTRVQTKPTYIPTPIYQTIAQPIPQGYAPIREEPVVRSTLKAEPIRIPTFRGQVPVEERNIPTPGAYSLNIMSEDATYNAFAQPSQRFENPQRAVVVPKIPKESALGEMRGTKSVMPTDEQPHLIHATPLEEIKRANIRFPQEESAVSSPTASTISYAPFMETETTYGSGLTILELEEYAKALGKPGNINYARTTLNKRIKERGLKDLSPDEQRRVAQEILTKSQKKYIRKTEPF